MNGFDSFFPSNSAPRNPYYRHSQARRPRASTSDRFFVLVGTIVVFMLFVGYQNFRNVAPLGGSPASIEEQAEAAAALSGNEKRPSLRATTTDEETDTNQQKRTLSSSPLSLKIMTFNLRFAGTGDGLNSWRYRKDHVADIIDRYHPAIMGTQEGLKAQLAELESLLNHPYERFGVEREENGEFEQIFYDAAVLERLDDGNFWLSEEPDTPGTQGWDAACVRMVTWGAFVFNTQLDHVGPKSREEGSKLLWARIQQISGDAPFFLMGDFNTYRHTSTYSYFTSQEGGPQLREAWPEAAKQIGDVSYTYHGWAGVKNDGEKTAVRAANHIDWIFYRPQMKVLATEVITEDRKGRYPSDHYPIQAELLFPSPAELPPPGAN
ncbi:Endonuclease/Exonuclease/phosphatase family [Phytophthora infestans]|uniref:Endonuclease/Exonuclease/phosphatase family n=1 Tax=Phytophthora infestans TaxID=4787 RepID=A0A833S6P0_PHYIN|nr:Endonuclease/Exonuclease/phosphatase family [Phytophthora infestans]